jgi:hypothetical protein
MTAVCAFLPLHRDRRRAGVRRAQTDRQTDNDLAWVDAAAESLKSEPRHGRPPSKPRAGSFFPQTRDEAEGRRRALSRPRFLLVKRARRPRAQMSKINKLRVRKSD